MDEIPPTNYGTVHGYGVTGAVMALYGKSLFIPVLKRPVGTNL
jgi:hypothetical protein